MEEKEKDNAVVVDETTTEPQIPDLTVLQGNLAQLEKQAKTFEDNWKNQEKATSRKEQEIQRLRDQVANNDSQQNMIKALIATMANRQNVPEEEFEQTVKKQQPDLLKQFEEMEKQAMQKRQVTEFQRKINDIQDKTEALGLKAGDEDYEVVQAFAIAGKFDKAESKLQKLEAKDKTEPPKETKSELSEEEKAKIVKEYLDKEDLLKQETGKPSGGSFDDIPTDINKFREWLSGLSTEEYEKYAPKVNELRRQGKFK